MEHEFCLLIVICIFSCTEWPDVSISDTVLHPRHESILTEIAIVLLFLSCLQRHACMGSASVTAFDSVLQINTVCGPLFYDYMTLEKKTKQNNAVNFCLQCQINQVNGVPVNKRFPAFVL